jgi:WD40 repeat protein
MSSRLRAARGAKTWSTAASADGRFVIRSTTAREVILTDRTSNREFDLSAEHVSAVAFQVDGESFVAAGSDGRITVWDAVNGELLRTVSTQTEGFRSVAISPVGDTVVAGSRDGSVTLHHLTTGQPAVPLATFASCVNCVRFSPDGKQVAVATGDWMSDGMGEVMLIDTATGQTMSRLDCATVPGAVSFASNEELVVGLWTGQAQLWNLSNRQVVGAASTDKNVVAAAAFSPDNPALLEVSFRATNPAGPDYKSPLSLIQGILGSP